MPNLAGLSGYLNLRLLAAPLLVLAFVMAQGPLHEYAHCASWWARGGEGPCIVAFAAPTRALSLDPQSGGCHHWEDEVRCPHEGMERIAFTPNGPYALKDEPAGLHNAAAVALSVGAAPWWEHPLMYAAHALGTAGFGVWLVSWVRRGAPRRRRVASEFGVRGGAE